MSETESPPPTRAREGTPGGELGGVEAPQVVPLDVVSHRASAGPVVDARTKWAPAHVEKCRKMLKSSGPAATPPARSDDEK